MAVVCASISKPAYQPPISISATLLSCELPGIDSHKPLESTTFQSSCLLSAHESFPPPILPQPRANSLSASAQEFTPRNPDPTTLANPPHFLGCSNSDNDLYSSQWGYNVCYNSGPEIKLSGTRPEIKLSGKAFKPPSSEEEWETDKGSEDEDWHAKKEANLKRNNKKFNQICLQIQDSSLPRRRSKRLSDLKARNKDLY
ncbi:unnamed protein product [Cuscuta campestris]|uniref:Uncharacterized protein n=1 Tax=Cuscuta campestris TaxID=132261 RepID=A0A484MMS0_9ASTE|nr:unnamed protein product [Cuscuta campestris]